VSAGLPDQLRQHLLGKARYLLTARFALVDKFQAFGQILCIGVLRGLLNREDEWAYRIAFAVQYV
jgi:hypothetical protein